MAAFYHRRHQPVLAWADDEHAELPRRRGWAGGWRDLHRLAAAVYPHGARRPMEREFTAPGADGHHARLPDLQLVPGEDLYGQRRGIPGLHHWRAEHHRRGEDGDDLASDGPAAAGRSMAGGAALVEGAESAGR